MVQMTTCDLHNETIIRLQQELAAAVAAQPRPVYVVPVWPVYRRR